jgi:hypothetical protein
MNPTDPHRVEAVPYSGPLCQDHYAVELSKRGQILTSL